jgi:hypothetical protein
LRLPDVTRLASQGLDIATTKERIVYRQNLSRPFPVLSNVPHQRRAANVSRPALYLSRVRCMRLLGGTVRADTTSGVVIGEMRKMQV